MSSLLTNGMYLQQQGGGPVQGAPGSHGNGQNLSEAGISAPPEYSLGGVLHFLQTEWRRHERDRNEWEIERAEMRARIALLEGERRGVENLKTDLMRRVKMLEYALRQERNKYLSSGAGSTITAGGAGLQGTISGIPATKFATLQGADRPASSSGRSSPARQESDPSASAEPATHQRGGSTFSINTLNMGTVNGLTLSGPGASLSRSNTTNSKNSRARAKAQEYLKQCLQEISYLTSTSTLNPLPDRAYTGTGGGSFSIVRPRKALLDNAPPSGGTALDDGLTLGSRSAPPGRVSGRGGTLGAPRSSLATQALPEESSESETGSESHQGADPLGATGDVQGKSPLTEPLHAAAALDDRMAPPPAPSAGTTDLPAEYGADLPEDDEPNQVTARYRGAGDPADATASDWAKLKEAGQREREKRERQRKAQAAVNGGETASEAATLATTSSQLNQLLKVNSATRSAEDDLANLSLHEPADEAAAARAEAEKSTADDEAAERLWKSKRVLRNHLDAVRAIAFDSTDAISASDDNTIKFWHLDPATLDQPSRTAADNEPVLTFRGHTAPVTCLAVASATRRMFSGSMDSSVRVWKLPERPFTPYPPYENMELASLAGHTQAVWDMALLPQQGEGLLLATASADGTVKIWTTDDRPALQLSWDYHGTNDGRITGEAAGIDATERPVPTSVCVVHSDLRTVAVSYSNSIVKLFELKSGREVLKLKSDSTYQGTPASQVNKIVAHPTLPFLVSAHEDRHIRVFDLGTGDCTFEMLAHLDAVTALDIDPAGLTLVSGGHDCSVRFWDINGIAGGATGSEVEPAKETSKAGSSQAVCVQEITAHRRKSSEGVLAVLYHPSAPFFASSGADGVVRIYG
ncbi:Cell-cycle nuclear protein, contains WD-40 repeats [Ceraceosorus bombacis]|uniref:Cell-cycle nuclear protein, contains WD-40 repeats n=1 Tax=Ceraceosorus bombacis TaxID=401625 RepID=A0A0P1BFZ1_9BASI|nr:Cell-cycle nuclear protein, contains WD-40 repeats [Ceraceosorus bombacis]